MAQNTAPIFTQTPNIGFGTINTSNNTFDMATSTSHSLFVAGASGSYVSKIRVKPSGSTGATVLRFFLNNGLTTTNGANNSLYAELSMPAITSNQSLAQNDFEIPLNIAMPSGSAIYGVSANTISAGSGFKITTIGGDY
jgi:hypothetical protein